MTSTDKTWSRILKDDGVFPNNPNVPLVIYPGVFQVFLPETIEEILAKNAWPPAWRYGVYPYHHYHSTAHEFLGCFQGNARILFGGDQGHTADISPGDGVMIPAGVAHKCLTSSPDFLVVGAYPRGQSPDMKYGRPGERPGVDENIFALGPPQNILF